MLRGDNERGRAHSEESLAVAHELGSAGAGITPEAMVNLGLAALGLGEYERAGASFEEALMSSQSLGLKSGSRELTLIGQFAGRCWRGGIGRGRRYRLRSYLRWRRKGTTREP